MKTDADLLSRLQGPGFGAGLHVLLVPLWFLFDFHVAKTVAGLAMINLLLM